MPYTVCARRSKTKYCPEAACWNATGSSNSPTMAGGMAPTERRTSTRSAADVPASRPAPTKKSTRATFRAPQREARRRLIRREIADGVENIRRARQDRFLENRRVGHRTIERGHAFDRRVEILEQLVGDARRDLGAEAAGELV